MLLKPLLSTLTLSLLITPFLVHAQNAQAVQAQAQAALQALQQSGTQPNITLTDAHLKQFALAQQQINAAHNAFAQKYANMNEQEKAQALASLNQTLAQVVKASGITVEQMSAMSQAIRNNPDLQRRLLELMR